MESGYALGLFFILLVALIWAAASVLVQYIYENREFHSPFLLTYVGVSLFTLWLPFRCVANVFRDLCRTQRPPDTSQYQQVSSIEDIEAGEEDIRDDEALNDVTPRSRRSSGAASENQGDLEYPLETTPAHEIVGINDKKPWTEQDHLYAALQICPVWFLANWTYSGSLAYTSITSSTVLASTGSLFTFLFAVMVKDEGFGYVKLAGVILGVVGSCLTALHDSSSDDGSSTGTRPVLGDILGLISAIGYGAYAVQTRVLCPRDESLYSMQLILGYIGLVTMVALSPVAAYIVLYKVELPMVVLGFLMIKGFFDNVISDYLWLRAVILTNATVATVGLGLTIPLAFLSDVVMGHSNVLTPGAVVGAIAVLFGFVLVNAGEFSHTTDHSSSVGTRDEQPSLQLPNISDG